MQCKDCKNFLPISEYKGYSKIGVGFCKDCGGYFERIMSEDEANSEFMECDIEGVEIE